MSDAPVAPRASVPRALVARSLVAIDGIDGSGKSRLARTLAAACEAEGASTFVFRVDDFRRPLGALADDVDEAAIYYDRYYDFALLDACLRAFLAGAPGVAIPRFDPATEALAGAQELTFTGAELALLEGVFVLRASAATSAPLIVLEVTEAEARRRILERDMARGRSRDLVEHRMNHRYFPAQRAYRAAYDPMRRAAVVIDNERWERPRLVRHEPGGLPRLVEKVLSLVVPS